MYLNNFSVRVIGGHEKASGYVEMRHGQVYKLSLRNSRFRLCDVQIDIDGKDIGTWRIPANVAILLERPSNDRGQFTFYKVGTREARQAQLDVSSDELGLIKATFTPEIVRPPAVNTLLGIDEVDTYNTKWTPITWMGDDVAFGASLGGGPVVACAGGGRGSSAGSPKGLSAGGTGLSGKSNQRFGNTYPIEYDYEQQTVIHLRLVSEKEDAGPRPLTARANPVPPRFY